MMYEYLDHKSVTSNFAQRPMNIKASEGSVKTDKSMLHKDPHLTGTSKEII